MLAVEERKALLHPQRLGPVQGASDSTAHCTALHSILDSTVLQIPSKVGLEAQRIWLCGSVS